MDKTNTTTNAAGATQPAWAARPYSALRADGTLIARAEYHYDRDAITWARSLGAAMLLDAIQRDIMPAPAPTLTSHTDTRGNVWFTITRGDETLLETRDEDAANQMATDLDIMSCEDGRIPDWLAEMLA